MIAADVCRNLACLAVVSLGLLSLALGGCSYKSKASENSRIALAESSTSGEEDKQALAVQTVAPTHKDLVVKFEQPGTMEAEAQADLFSRVTGYVKKVHVDIGDTVTAGQVLLEIDLPDAEQDVAYKDALVRQAEAEREQAEAGVQTAEAALIAHKGQLEKADAEVKKAESEQHFRQQQAKRYANLAASDATTRELAEEKQEQWEAAISAYDSSVANRKAVQAETAVLTAKLEAAKADLHTKTTKVDVAKADRDRARVMLEFAQLKAPFDGVITRRTVDEGNYVNSADAGRGTPILTLARSDVLRVVLRVPEKEVRAVHNGSRARMRLEAIAGREVEGRVARFAHALDKDKTMRVEIDIDNKSGELYPGMYGSVTVFLQEISNALTVPGSAIDAVGGKSYVIVVRAGKAHRVQVTTGADDGITVQILNGLQGKEDVVITNKGQITEGQALQPHRVKDAETKKE